MNDIKEANSWSISGNIITKECSLILYNEDKCGNQTDSIFINLKQSDIRGITRFLQSYIKEQRMKFYIESTKYGRSNEIVDYYPQLLNFGFTRQYVEVPFRSFMRDECGNVISQDNVRLQHLPYIRIDSLEQLISLIKELDSLVIVNIVNIDSNDNYYLEIYDDYRE